MQSSFISKEHLKQVLSEIHHFLNQHKKPKPNQPSTDKQNNKLNQQQQQRLKQKLTHLHAADIAHILEGLSLEDRLDVWQQIPAEQHGEILLALSQPVRESMLGNMPLEDMVTAAEKLPSAEIADLANLAQNLPEQAVEHILQSLTQEQRQQLEAALSYPDGTVGSLMDFSMLTAGPDDSVKDVLAYYRKLGVLPEHSHHIYVVDASHTLLGELPLQQLITLDVDKTISEVMSPNMISFTTGDSAEQATFAFNRYGLTSAPVIDENNQLIGRICIDDIVEFMNESSEQQMFRQVGFMAGEDRFAGILSNAKNRWVWLAINLFAAFIATRVIVLFEDKIVELVILATLMPVVASTAGNVGNQACTLIIRSLAIGQITDTNVRQFFLKEIGVSLVNGLIMGGIMGVFVGNLYGAGIGVVMAAAIVINFIITSFIAVSIPIVRHKVNLDPAMGAHVLVTFVADSFGFFIFLGMATLFL
ncbi:MAG: magnesium transporter [Gammaproteobacteria bacterium]|nr:magnesium transporter [Gammaproteobacteria bacterium]